VSLFRKIHLLMMTLKRSKTPAGKDLSPPQQHQGMFHQAHNLSATGNFIDVSNLSGKDCFLRVNGHLMNNISISNKRLQFKQL
jgi:hypothetical protein